MHGTDSAIDSPANRLPLDLPVAAAEHRNALAFGGDAVHVDLVRADHEVDVRLALVDARHDRRRRPANLKPAPSAMWLAAFSSRSVL